MNFQGRLTDSTGNIKPNGSYNMKLRLYTVSSGGSTVWTEDRLVSASQGVTVTNGLFSIKLGDITTLPASLFASGELYLEVELPTPATATSSSPSWTEGAMTPRNQMATSAYAYNAETLDGLDSAAFAQLDQNNTFTGNNVFDGTLQGSSATLTGNLIANGGLDFVAYAPFARFSSNRIALGSNGNTYSGMDFTVRNDTGITSETSGFTYTRFGATNLGGNINTQRFNVFNAPSYTGAFTLTNAATVAIGGAATPSGGAVITNNYSLWTQGGTVRMDTGAAGTVGLVIRGAASQTADLLHLQSDGGTVIAKIDAAGAVHGSQLVSTVSTGTAPLTVASTTKVTNLNADSLDGIDSASFAQLDQNNTFTGNTVFDGTLQGGSSLTLGTASVAGNLVISDGSSNTATVTVGALAGNYDYSIPVTTANDTFCMVTLANCSGVATVGTYSTTNTSATGATISGTTITFQDASATAPGMVGTGTQTFAGNKTFSGELKVSKSSSSVQVALLQVEQTGTGDTTLELKNAAGKSFYFGMDQSAGGLLRIGSSTSSLVNNQVGSVTAGASTATGQDSSIRAKKVTTGPTVSGTLSSIAVHLSLIDATNPGVKVGLYSHDAVNDRPDALIASTDVSTNGIVGWNTLPLSASIASSTTYWLSVNVEGSTTRIDYTYCPACGGRSAYYYPMAFNNTWPSSLGAPNSFGTDEDWSFYMNVASGSVTDTFAGAKLFGMTDTGATTLQNSTDSAAAFQVQNAAGASIVNVDTTSSRVTIGAVDTTGVLLVLDTKTSAGDPTGVEGGMYYNDSLNRFRCYEGSAWRNCAPSKLHVSSDVSSTDATNWADITGLTMSVNSGETYMFACFLTYTTAATTTAIHLSVNGPASPTALDYAVDASTSSTARHNSAQTTYDTVTNSGTGGGATRLPVQINGTITPSANGTLAFRLKSEVGSSAVTIKRGSYCTIQ